MTDYVQKIEQLENAVAQLKIRVFDANELAAQNGQIAEGFKKAIIEIATAVGLSQDADVTVDQVVDKVVELVKSSQSGGEE